MHHRILHLRWKGYIGPLCALPVVGPDGYNPFCDSPLDFGVTCILWTDSVIFQRVFQLAFELSAGDERGIVVGSRGVLEGFNIP
jgi:hypothetical protein